MKRTLFLLSAVVLLSSCGSAQDTQGNLSQVGLPVRKIVLASGEKQFVVHAEIARTDQERSIGLMYRTHLQQGRGMLFVFDQEQPMSFWMKNTLIPLDIVFFDKHGRYVSALTMNPCTSDPCPLYNSLGAAQYVLEVPAHTLRNQGIDSHWSLKL